MPAAVVAVAAWVGNAVVAVLGTSAVATAIATAAANAVLTLGFASGIGAGLSAWATVASVATAFASTRKPKIGLGQVGTQVDTTADPNAGVPFLMGRTGVGGSLVHMTTDGQANKNQHLFWLAILSAGVIQGVESVVVNNAPITFTAETADTAPYVTGLDLRVQLGYKPSDPFPPPSVPDGTVVEWTAAHKLSGLGAAWFVQNYHQPMFPSGPVKPLFIVNGPKVYDPRQDSTYPGGSGAQRAANEDTWSFTGNDNPYLQALSFLLGRWDGAARDRLIIGPGVPVESIDVAAFVEGANICDANGWTIGGRFTSLDRKWEVLKAMLQAGGGEPAAVGGRISCTVNAPKVSLATITAADLMGDPDIPSGQRRRVRFNTFTSRFRCEAQGFDLVPAGVLDFPDLVAEDGRVRSTEYEFPFVQDVDQAAQLGGYMTLNTRERDPVLLPLKPEWMDYKAGDMLTVDDPELGLEGVNLLIRRREIDPQTGAVVLTCRTENPGNHTQALAMSGTEPGTPLDGLDPGELGKPGAGAWTLTGATLTNGAASTPAIVLTGAFDNINATRMIVQYRVYGGGGSWNTWPYIDSTATRIEITGLAADATYEVRTAYMNDRAISDWRDEGTAVAGSSAVTGQGDWATYNALSPTQIAGRTVYLDDTTGQLTSVLGLGQPTSGFGQALTIDSNPISSDDSHLYIAAFTVKGFGGFTRSFSSGSFSGFPSGFNWHILVYWPTGGYGVAHNNDLQSYLATGDWFLLGIGATSVSGAYTPPAIDNPGSYGGGAGDFFYRDVN